MGNSPLSRKGTEMFDWFKNLDTKFKVMVGVGAVLVVLIVVAQITN